MTNALKHSAACSTLILLFTAPAWAQPQTSASARAEGEQQIHDKVIVTGEQIPYLRLSETATKTNLDLMDTPLSVTLLNKAFLEDLHSERLADAYPYTLGLSQSGTNANSFTLRGLSASLQNVQINGLPGLASRFGSPTSANIERVEVVKGPASVLYGLMEPGGLVNIVTKRPEEEASNTLTFTTRSYASETSGFGDDTGAGLTFDSTGSLTDDGKWLYRLIARVETQDTFRDGVSYDNVYLFPSLTYRVSPEAEATFGLEYVKEDGDADDGLAAVNNDIDQTAPINVRYQEDGDFDNDEGLVAFAHVNWDISAKTRLRLNLRSVFHEDERKLYENNRVNDAPDLEDATLRRRDRHQLNKREYHFVDLNISHAFDTGPAQHNLLAGLNGGFERADYERIRFGSAISPNISILDPAYGVGEPVAITAGTDRITDYLNYGAYIQDVAAITDWLTVMVGGRYDRQDVDFTEQTTDFTDDQMSDVFLPQGGIVIRPNDALSLYASYTESFNPNSVQRRDANGESFNPERGEQTEAGLKASLFDEQLNLTFAVFDIEKTNIVETNLNGDLQLLGGLESQGAEFELQALPLENWQVRFGYAYTDSVISQSPDEALIGRRNAFAPEHDAFFWTRYNLPRDVWNGTVGASVGVNYESDRVTNASPSTQVELPGYTRLDLGFYYEADQYRMALSMENIADETYYTGGTRDTRIFPGDPRLLILSLRAKL
ncbi:ferrichrome-iron receptor [Parvularcula bermudensis HTCC2503]|uniref:Ferrichrome-iron receptor n=1 Tax=Parvularcula bermudensis (strain ATCC BAA-594 / HTCC2503 / KCTC 12087) TaxID=314260 RepID=E0TFD1_PARBH|nr:TonB-dependent siderophore receptor [Parvularcula bermudensis]ADM09532.1 ferrichrome-iron receptor [Parvularcula bermudensis HTCC2503]